MLNDCLNYSDVILPTRMNIHLVITSSNMFRDYCMVLNFSKQLNKLTFGVAFCQQFDWFFSAPTATWGRCWTWDSLLRFSTVRRCWTSQQRTVDGRQVVSSLFKLFLCFLMWAVSLIPRPSHEGSESKILTSSNGIKCPGALACSATREGSLLCSDALIPRGA